MTSRPLPPVVWSDPDREPPPISLPLLTQRLRSPALAHDIALYVKLLAIAIENKAERMNDEDRRLIAVAIAEMSKGIKEHALLLEGQAEHQAQAFIEQLEEQL